MKFNRIFLIVLDSLGIGETIDAKKFGDEGCNTLGHIIENTNITIPKVNSATPQTEFNLIENNPIKAPPIKHTEP